MDPPPPPKRRRSSASPASPPPPVDDERSPKRARQSFLSPTRASMSRHNPNVLERRMRDSRPRSGIPRPSSQPARPGTDTTTTETPTTEADHQVTSASQPTSIAPDGGQGSPTRSLGGGMAAQPRRTPGALSQSPAHRRRNIFGEPARRPSAGPGENPFKGRTLRRSPPAASDASTSAPAATTGARAQAARTSRDRRPRPPAADLSNLPLPGEQIGDSETAEPELPPTPTQRGIEDPIVTTPPTGIHGTPSKRRRGLMDRKGKAVVKSSPLKQQPLRMSSPTRHTSPSQGRGGSVGAGKATAGDMVDAENKENNTTASLKPHPARNVPPPDPNDARKKTREKLKSQIKRLERDIGLAAKLNDRITASSAGGRQLSATETAVLLDLLRRTELPKEESREAKVERSLKDVLSLLANPTTTFPNIPTTTTTTQDPASPPLLRTHLPLKLPPPETLPYLHAFTPLRFTSTTTMLPRSNPTDPLLQSHHITAASPDGLFSARIELTVDAAVPAITRLAVPALTPAAEPELRPLIRTLTLAGPGAAAAPVTTSAQNNVSTLGWAMGEWYRAALRRAGAWARLHRALGTRERVVGSVRELRARGKGKAAGRRRRRQQQQQQQQAEDSEEGGEEEDGEGKGKGEGMSMREARLLLGRRDMEFDIPLPGGGGEDGGAKLRVEWSVEFDWTGEARSRVGVLVGVPGKWRKADTLGSIAGLPDMVDKFVSEDKDPVAAVTTVVSLLAGDVDGFSRA